MSVPICDICNLSCQTQFLLNEHKNVHNEIKPFLCPNCGEPFALLQEYVKHYKQYPQDHYFPCPVCSIVLKSKDELDFHTCAEPFSAVDHFLNGSTDNEHEKEKSQNYCDGCNKSFSSKKQLRIHLRKFPGPHYFKCQWCQRTFKSNDNLSKHLCASDDGPITCSCLIIFQTITDFKVHVGPKPHKCCKCNLTFKDISNLTKHIRTHTRIKPYVCKYCGRSFAQAANLKNHISMHEGPNPVMCDLCPFTCKTPVGLLKHKRKHAKGEEAHDLRKISNVEYNCSRCGKQFRFKRNLVMHLKFHDGEESLCWHCGKMFKGRSKLSKHLKNCHGEVCVCTVCGKTFVGAVLLRAHSKTHITTKKYSCHVCFKAFSLKSYLFYHFNTHDKIKRFSCNDCGKSFKVETSLKSHSKVCDQKTKMTEN